MTESLSSWSIGVVVGRSPLGIVVAMHKVMGCWRVRTGIDMTGKELSFCGEYTVVLRAMRDLHKALGRPCPWEGEQ